MTTFADKLFDRMQTLNSVLCAGFDPTPEQIPEFLKRDDPREFGEIFIEAVNPYAACIKFNAAFFEAFGIKGLETLQALTKQCRSLKLPVIIDAKRGDIGNTAAAYARAWLGEDATCAAGDALTVNPYLGFDTLDPFIERCKATKSGLFVLVRTSNPGAQQMQEQVSDRVAGFLSSRSDDLMGQCGYSGLGAVVGATDAHYQVRARELMPKNLFLVPGFGAQGASAAEATAGLGTKRRGGVVNSSRALVQTALKTNNKNETLAAIAEAAKNAVAALR